MAVGTFSPYPVHQFFDNAGEPANGYKLFSYLPGTTTKTPTWNEQTLTTQNANPIILDSAGRATIYLDPVVLYKFVLAPPTDTDPPASPLWTRDPIHPIPVNISDATDITGTAGETLAIGNVIALSNGDGGLVAGRWYKTDRTVAHLSHKTGELGVALTAVLAGSTVQIRIAGRVTGLSGLVAGGLYALHDTPGALLLDTNVPTDAPPVYVGMADTTTSLVIPSRFPNEVSVNNQDIGVGNVGTGEDTLAEYIAPVGELRLLFDSHEVTAAGTFANNANAKTLRLRVISGAFNTVALSSTLPVSVASGVWNLHANLAKLSTNVHESTQATIIAGAASSPTATTATDRVQYSVDGTATTTIRLTGEATANNDIVVQQFRVRLVRR